jgi:hypothetical protein
VRQYANLFNGGTYVKLLVLPSSCVKYFEVAILPQLLDTESIKVFFIIKQALLLRSHIGYVQRRIQEVDERRSPTSAEFGQPIKMAYPGKWNEGVFHGQSRCNFLSDTDKANFL